MSSAPISGRKKSRAGKGHGPHLPGETPRGQARGLFLLRQEHWVPLLGDCRSREWARLLGVAGRWGSPLVLPYPAAVADLRLPSRVAPQDQLKQLQEILGSLSLQEEKTRASHHRLDQQLNNEAQQSSSLVAQLRAMVAEREAKVRQLELEIGQLSVQVGSALARPSIHF